jgi:hypothetical protein
MANLAHIFDNGFMADEIEEQDSGFEPLPTGNYPVVITGSELRDNKNLTGVNMTLKFNVTAGKYQNRILFENLCVQHQNSTAQGIAQVKLKKLCEALGITKLVDTSELHDKPLIIAVGIEPDDYATQRAMDGQQVFRNMIKSYFMDTVALDKWREEYGNAEAKKARLTPKQRAMADTGPGVDDYSDDIPF